MEGASPLGGTADFAGAGVQAGMPASAVTLLVLAYLAVKAVWWILSLLLVGVVAYILATCFSVL